MSQIVSTAFIENSIKYIMPLCQMNENILDGK